MSTELTEVKSKKVRDETSIKMEEVSDSNFLNFMGLIAEVNLSGISFIIKSLEYLTTTADFQCNELRNLIIKDHSKGDKEHLDSISSLAFYMGKIHTKMEYAKAELHRRGSMNVLSDKKNK